MEVIKKYILGLLKLWIYWFWAPALEALALFTDPYIPGFSIPREVHLGILALGFLVANVKLFSDQEIRITELVANKVDALIATIQELEMNRASADHNAAVRGQTKSPGALPFMRLDDHSCKEVFLSGRFTFNQSLLQAVREYLQTINHMNTLITSVEARTAKFQNAAGTADAIRRYCGGQLNPELNGRAKSLPDVIDNLQELIEHEINVTEIPGTPPSKSPQLTC
jgi:hypothetical protein